MDEELMINEDTSSTIEEVIDTTKERKKLLKEIIVSGISLFLLLIVSLIDLKNPLSLLSKRRMEVTQVSSQTLSIIPFVVYLVLTIVTIVSLIRGIICYVHKESSKEQITKSSSFVNTFNIVPITLTIIFALSLIFTPVMVNGTSMEPTYYENDFLIVSRVSEIKKDDIAIVDLLNGTLIIKRVVAVPGDYLEVDYSGVVKVNGEVIETKRASGLIQTYSCYLKEGEYYCMGDNRNVSLDSRQRGIFKEDQIIGKVVLKVLGK